jgi:hypothetical protein
VRRRATLVATVLDTITRLTDDTVALFDRAVGRMFRRDGGDPGPFVLIPFKSTSPRSDSWHRIGRNFACAYIRTYPWPASGWALRSRLLALSSASVALFQPYLAFGRYQVSLSH